jgi:hypothetical protein
VVEDNEQAVDLAVAPRPDLWGEPVHGATLASTRSHREMRGKSAEQAFFTREALGSILDTMLESVSDFAAGRRLTNEIKF